ncbi:MAG: ABC transporter permease subunit [Hyphomicrobiaceae bacterium]
MNGSRTIGRRPAGGVCEPGGDGGRGEGRAGGGPHGRSLDPFRLDPFRLAPVVALGILVVPVGAGLLGVILPSLGYLPALGGTRLGLQPWAMLFDMPGVWRSAAISLAAGILSALIAFAVTMLFLAGSLGTPVFEALRRLISPLLSVPHAATAFAIAFLIAPSGLIVRMISPWATGWTRPPDLLVVHDALGLALIAGLVVKEIPFLLLVSLAVMPQIDATRRRQVALSLGYRPVAGFLKAVLPALYPLIRLPVFAVIAYASSTVDMALILGPTSPPTLGVSIVRWLYDADLAMRFMASAGAAMQLGVTLTAILVWIGLERAAATVGRALASDGRRRAADRSLTIAARVAMLAVALTAGLGLLGLALWSVAGLWRFPDPWPGELTAGVWQGQARALAGALLQTLQVGLAATLGALLLVVAMLENEVRRGRTSGRGTSAILYLPLVIPPVAFLFGLVIAAEAVGISPGFWLVVGGHVVFVLPYVHLSLSEAYLRLDRRWGAVAASLGASPGRVLLGVRLPLVLTPVLTAAAVGFAVSVGQYLPTQLLGGGRVATVTTEAVALAAGADRRVVGVWALAQALLPAAGFLMALGLPRLVWRHRRAMRDAR